MYAMLTTTVSILKLRIGVFIALAAVIGLMTGGGTIGLAEGTIFTLAVLGASGAAGGFNQYFERETDRLMARTFNRPFATGRLKSGAIWPLSFTALLAVSLLMSFATGGTLATAGLIQRVSRQAINGLPALMNIPIIGTLFRSRDYQREETELMIAVTPYIVKPVGPNGLQRPDDGFVEAHDAQTILMGRLN